MKTKFDLKGKCINEDTTYESDDINNLILEHYNEIVIFHKINALITDNFIEEKVVIENIIQNNGKQSDKDVIFKKN